MTENIIGGDETLPENGNGTGTQSDSSLNLNNISGDGNYTPTGLINEDVEAYLVGNVNLIDTQNPDVQLLADQGGDPNAGDPQVSETEVNTGDPQVTTGDPQVTTGDPQVTTGDPQVTTGDPQVTGRDPYNYSGDPGDQTGASDVSPGIENPGAIEAVEGTKVTVQQGQTLWGIIGQHYGGKYPLEAVYAANNMEPRVVEKDGKKELVDPVYHVGQEIILPAESQLEALTQKYRDRVNELGKTSEERVGGPDERTDVNLIFGDTLYSLAQKKYGTDNPPLAAIYEANNMTPEVVQNNGQTELVAPTYYAGKTYTLPAASEVAELEKKFWERMGRPQEVDPNAPVPQSTDTPDPYGNSGSPEDQENFDPNVDPDNPGSGPGQPPRNTRY